MSEDKTATRHENRLAQIMDRCRHFTGVQHDTCEAGVAYASVRDTSQPGPYRWPCFAKNGATTSCALVNRPTREEAEAEEAAFKACFARVKVARQAITDKHGKARGLGGEMPCPNGCGGILRYSIAGVNGHIHGSCSTADCASWME